MAWVSLRQAGSNIVTDQSGHNWTWRFDLKEGSPWRDLRVRRGANLAMFSRGSGRMQVLAMNEALQQQLKDVDIDITFEVFDWNSLLGTWREGAGAASARGC